MIEAAKTGPTPFRVSRVASSAVLMLTSAPVAPGTPVVPGVVPGTVPGTSGSFLRHEDLLPVDEGRREVQQREIGVVACAAGAFDRVDHRSPGSNANTPGLRTHPVTSTISGVVLGLAEVEADGATATDADGTDGAAAIGAALVAMSIGRGNERARGSIWSPPVAVSDTATTPARSAVANRCPSNDTATFTIPASCLPRDKTCCGAGERTSKLPSSYPNAIKSKCAE